MCDRKLVTTYLWLGSNLNLIIVAYFSILTPFLFIFRAAWELHGLSRGVMGPKPIDVAPAP